MYDTLCSSYFNSYSLVFVLLDKYGNDKGKDNYQIDPSSRWLFEAIEIMTEINTWLFEIISHCNREIEPQINYSSTRAVGQGKSVELRNVCPAPKQLAHSVATRTIGKSRVLPKHVGCYSAETHSTLFQKRN